MKRIRLPDNTKRTKLSKTRLDTNHSSRERITHFEDLANEIFYEIFEFLDFHNVFESFFDLNLRFQKLLLSSNFFSKISISFISRSTFHRYYTQILIPKIHKIKSLRLANSFSTDIVLSLVPVISKFTHLEALSLNNIESEYLEDLLISLFFIPNLSSLILKGVNHVNNQNNLYRQIFRLIKLKYCRILFSKSWIPVPLPIATTEFSSIEHFVIDNDVSFNQLDSLLSYIPKIRRLTFQSLSGFHDERIRLTPIVLNHLTELALRLHSISFDQFESLFKNFFHQIQVLSIYVDHKNRLWSARYLDANRWKQLILSHIPHLRRFDFKYESNISDNNTNRPACEIQMNGFNSSFWIERQWYFVYQYYQRGFIFYSTEPYRRKSYSLYGQIDKKICSTRAETKINSVHHLCIHNEHGLNNCVNYFPNVCELTFLYDIDILQNSMIATIDRIISLRKLTKLVIVCRSFSFEQMIELLRFTPNIHTLKIDSFVFNLIDCLSLQQNETFQMVSNTNTITTVSIKHECTLEKIQLLIALFPRLECLTNNLYKEDLELIIRFVLLKTNNNNYRLSSWCISKRSEDLIEKCKNLINSEKLLHNYTIKVIDQELYLWW